MFANQTACSLTAMVRRSSQSSEQKVQLTSGWKSSSLGRDSADTAGQYLLHNQNQNHPNTRPRLPLNENPWVPEPQLLPLFHCLRLPSMLNQAHHKVLSISKDKFILHLLPLQTSVFLEWKPASRALSHLWLFLQVPYFLFHLALPLYSCYHPFACRTKIIS